VAESLPVVLPPDGPPLPGKQQEAPQQSEERRASPLAAPRPPVSQELQGQLALELASRRVVQPPASW
jgi:hypothetical protein